MDLLSVVDEKFLVGIFIGWAVNKLLNWAWDTGKACYKRQKKQKKKPDRKRETKKRKHR